MARRIYLNEDWKFTREFSEELLKKDYDLKNLEQVRLPHTNIETPFHYFDEEVYQMVCGYKKVLYAEEEWKGKHIMLTFDGAAHLAYVYINGTEVARHACGYTAFTVDLSEHLAYGEENDIVVKLDSNETLNIPPYGLVIDYMTYGGLYREVYLDIKEDNFIADTFITTNQVLSEQKELCADVTLFKEAKDGKVIMTLYTDDSLTSLATKEMKVSGDKVSLQALVSGVELWNTKTPTLYRTKIEFFEGDKLQDEMWIRHGFRSCEFKNDGFYLNGEKLKIRGLNRHQSYPYVGYAMPKNAQVNDAKILKEELGLNAVRTSHYPQSHYFLEACDELGLLVFTEIPGWQHIGDEEWKAQAVKNTEEMVMQYRNHTSIIIWGVRINESKDDDAFYEKTNAVAHKLDPTRQTGGVRFIKKSNLLEDVYTYNDFLHDGKTAPVDQKKKVTSDMQKPYLVSEYNGHMYPTKSFDCEEHRLEHALRHAKVVDAIKKDDEITGGFGWCMFDYNTHKDFGSGDRICYHGVLDMFRNHKMAAHVYEAEQNDHDVLYVSSSMDIGEHPAGIMGDVYAFTNADAVKLYKNGRYIQTFNRENSPFTGMEHGPILIDDFIGDQLITNEGFSQKKSDGLKKVFLAAAKYGQNTLPVSAMLTAAKLVVFHGMKMQEAVELYGNYVGNWGGIVTTYRFEAIKDGKVVKVVEKKPMTKVHLAVTADHTDLKEESTYDVACIRMEARDEYDNLLNYYSSPVKFEVSGDIELIGPDVFALQGGMGGCYVKTTKKSGTGTLTVRGEQIEPVTVTFTIG